MSRCVCMYVQNLAELRIPEHGVVCYQCRTSEPAVRARHHTGRAVFVGEKPGTPKAESGDSDGLRRVRERFFDGLFSSLATPADKPSCACRQREYKKLQMYTTRLEIGEYGVSGLRRNASLTARHHRHEARRSKKLLLSPVAARSRSITHYTSCIMHRTWGFKNGGRRAEGSEGDAHPAPDGMLDIYRDH